MGFLKRMASALVFLAGSDRRVDRMPAERFARLAGTTMLIGMVWGLLLVGLWDILFQLTWPHHLNWIAPAVGCALAMVAGPYRLAAIAMIETAMGRRPWQRRIVGAVFTGGISIVVEIAGWVCKPTWTEGVLATWPGVRRWRQWLGLGAIAVAIAMALNHAVRWWNPDWPTHLPQAWAWLWPRALYRVLLLMPAWGSWSMLSLGQFHRPTPATSAAARRFATGVGPLATAVWLIVPLGSSLIYLNFLYPWHVLPPAVAAAAALGGGSLLVRLGGRLSRQTLLATNFLTQLAFLTAYLAVR